MPRKAKKGKEPKEKKEERTKEQVSLDELSMMSCALLHALRFGTKMKNMLSAAKKNKTPHGMLEVWVNENEIKVDGYRDEIEKQIKHTCWGPIIDLNGVGPGVSARIIGGCVDINRFENADHFNSFCGLIPGKNKKAGQKITYNPIAKDGFIQLANLRIRLASHSKKFTEYRKIFDEYKARKEKEIKALHNGKEGWKAHLNRMAIRRLAKLSAIEVFKACKGEA